MPEKSLWGLLWVPSVKVPTISVARDNTDKGSANRGKPASVAGGMAIVALGSDDGREPPALLLTEGL
jgi:hypothetical protein